jgi:Cu+-exporting ATPase
MSYLGVILIVIIVGLYFLWLRFQRKQEIAVPDTGGIQRATILVRGAYSPNVISVRAGFSVELTFDRQEGTECSRFVSFDILGVRKDLAAFGKTVVKLSPLKKGEQHFTCDMGMYQGKLIAE